LADHLKGANRALDVGSGSGYMTTLMSRMLINGFTYGMDHVKPLVKQSVHNSRKNN